ncbi:MAG: hypothetical protein GY754_12355 [bacterium]|nr:hypothetical protein [bacterium]
MAKETKQRDGTARLVNILGIPPAQGWAKRFAAFFGAFMLSAMIAVIVRIFQTHYTGDTDSFIVYRLMQVFFIYLSMESTRSRITILL